MFKKIAISIVVLFSIVLLYAATRPDTFRVERAASIKATPEKIFPFLNDLRSWGAWSPWEKMDPAMKRTFTGAAEGKGAAYAWEGNNKVGAGRMEIAESSPPSRLVIKLDFLDPFEVHNTAEFTLEARGDATEVTWAMYGPNPYLAKVIQVFFSMDSMVGKDFETGLANLRAVVEK